MFVKLAITIAVLSFLLLRVNWTRMGDTLRSTRGSLLAVAAAWFCAGALLEVARLRVVLAPYALGWRKLMRLHLIGVFFGSFLPGQLGGDLYKVIALRPLDTGVARPLTLILLPRVLGLGVALVAALGFLLIPKHRVRWQPTLPEDIPWTSWWIASLIAVSLGMALALGHPLLRSRWLGLWRAFEDQMREALSAVTASSVATLVMLSFFVLGTRALVLHTLTHAVGSPIALVEAIPVVAFATVALIFPISFAGLGLREGVVTLLLVSLEMPYERAVLVALLGRLLIFLLSATGGAWLAGETLASGRKAGAI